MQAWQLKALGGLDQLQLVNVPDPKPAAGEVLLQLQYAALNPADRYLSEGQYPARPALPHILGRDGMGTVLETGSGVVNFKSGDQAIILRGEAGVTRPGTFAQKVAVPEESLTKLPAGWTKEQAAAGTLVYLTAYLALSMWGDVPAAAVVLITGASGGVGVAGVQLARALGHSVIALSRSESKRATLQTIGAHLALEPADTQWRRKVKDFLKERRVNLAIDNIGGPLLPEVLDTLGMDGRVSIVGRLAGPVPQFNTAALLFRRLRIGGVAPATFPAATMQTFWNHSVELLASTNARPLIDSVHPFAAIHAAFHQLTKGPMGKVLLQIPP